MLAAPAIRAYTTEILRARDAYHRRLNQLEGICPACNQRPRAKDTSVCGPCRYARRKNR